jgi:sodium/potassium-transporting ATPase subunit alpha
MAFCGTEIIEGNGIGIVIRTGDKTVLGHIKDLANSVSKPKTKLSHEMKLINRILILPSVFLGILVLALGSYGKKTKYTLIDFVDGVMEG